MRRARTGGAIALLLGMWAAWLAPAPSLRAQVTEIYSVSTGAPEDVGFSAAGLARIGPAMQELIDAHRTAGVMTLVARRGKIVHWEAHGWRVLSEAPLERDDLFRIYSMTKPVTSVAVMMLVEQRLISLDDPVADFLPAFASALVWEEGEARPALRPITIRDLLTHTSGLTYGDFGRTSVDSMYRAEHLGVNAARGNLAQIVDVIATLPLLDDPGDRWNYGHSTDVLGRVIEVVSGRTLEDFFRDRIFEPLGMVDTGFDVPAEKLDRLTAMYAPEGDGLVELDSPVDGQFTQPARWLSGGAGLVSSAADYLRFCTMLLNEGELDGVRILAPETVREMTRNHLPEELLPIPIGGPDQGFGLGFAVGMGEHPGVYRWLGVAGTHFWIDPTEDLIAFAWTQLQPQGRAPVGEVLERIVYDAIVESAR